MNHLGLERNHTLSPPPGKASFAAFRHENTHPGHPENPAEQHAAGTDDAEQVANSLPSTSNTPASAVSRRRRPWRLAYPSGSKWSSLGPDA